MIIIILVDSSKVTIEDIEAECTKLYLNQI